MQDWENIDCQYQKETSFGRELGYLTCLNPAKKGKRCEPEICGRFKGDEGTAVAETSSGMEEFALSSLDLFGD